MNERNVNMFKFTFLSFGIARETKKRYWENLLRQFEYFPFCLLLKLTDKLKSDPNFFHLLILINNVIFCRLREESSQAVRIRKI